MSLKIHIIIRHRGCRHCTEVEEDYINLESSENLMYAVGELVRRQAENAHGPVEVYNFSLARKERNKESDSSSTSFHTMTESSSISVDGSSDDEPSPQQPTLDEPADENPGSPAEPASGNSDKVEDEEEEEATTAGGGGDGDGSGSGSGPGRLCNITAVVDWTSLPEARDTLPDLDMMSLTDDQCREVGDYLRSRRSCDLIILEYSLET